MNFLKYFLLLSLLFGATTIFTGCKNDETDSGIDDDIVVDVLESGDTAARTVLVYIMAENNLDYYAGLDLAEMRHSISDIPDSCYFLAFVDGLSNPYICRFYRNGKGIEKCDTVYSFDNDFNSTDTLHFNRVLDWVTAEYPSKSLGLVMWSHGSGWTRKLGSTRSIGADNNKNSGSDVSYRSMEIEDFTAAIGRLPMKPEYILFDACFMQSVEVAYELRNSAEWLVGSAAELPANGAPYDRIMAELFAFPFNPDALLQKYSKGYSSYIGVLLSAIKCSAMDELADATAAFVPAYFSSDSMCDYDSVFSYLPDGYFSWSEVYPDYFDMNGQMKLRFPNNIYMLWKEAFDAAVPYTVTTGSWYSAYVNDNISVDTAVYSAISIYMPQATSRNESLNADFATTEWFLDAGWGEAGW